MVWLVVVLTIIMLVAVAAGYWIGCADVALTRRRVHDLDTQAYTVRLLAGVHHLVHQMEVVIMATAELKAVLARIDTATNNIAEDIRLLKEKILTGMTAEQVAEVQAEAEAVAVKLEGIAASTEDPVPGEPV